MTMMQPPTTTIPDFSNTQIAFADRTNAELRKSYLLFSLMQYPWLVKPGGRVARWAFRWNLPVKGIVKHTIYGQFCGGENQEEVKQVIDRLGRKGIKTILDYGVEGKETEEDFDKTASRLADTLELAREDDDIHIISTKLSGLFRFELLSKITAQATLTEQEEAEWKRGVDRVNRICKAAFESGISVHVDAEESWIQGAIDQIAWEMSARYNLDRPTVINAVQLYRTDRLQFLKDSLEDARQRGYLCAVKLVRGAYMEKERERALAKGYPSPIHPDRAATDKAYNEGLRFCLDHIDELYVNNATHNEESVRLQTELMATRHIPADHPRVVTSQLYGMSDNLSYNMAQMGYRVEKYLPYGPVKEVIPYLIRRTQENTSVGGQMSRELRLIKEELDRRRKN
jgi:proline dehydrogenase